MIVHDITKEITSAPVYDGDPVTDFQWVYRIDCGDEYNLSKIKFCNHAGTHIDTPKHFIDDGKTITDYPMSRFYGSCTVITVDDVLTGEDMERILPRCHKKILIKGVEGGVLSLSAVFVMEEYGIELVGTENISIGFELEEMRVHRELAINDVLVIENLDLSKIKDGNYILVALPIKIEGAEASPTRVVLLEQEKGI
ncbi:MAG: cyclase family protein [Acutalibacteraceae bacterium]|nr:cyclase family protein [Acutalibacteraceae bacterium]